jgi:hypothetical protein
VRGSSGPLRRLRRPAFSRSPGVRLSFHGDPPTEVSADGQRAFAVTLALIVCHSSSSWPIDVLTARIREMIED